MIEAPCLNANEDRDDYVYIGDNCYPLFVEELWLLPICLMGEYTIALCNAGVDKERGWVGMVPYDAYYGLCF